MDKAKNHARRRINRLFESGRPVTVVFREKHDDTIYACLDRNEFERLCLAVLWERYHHTTDHEADRAPETPPIPRDQVAALPDGDTKRAAEGEWKHYDNATRWRQESLDHLRLTEAALRDRDGALAFLALDARKDSEYEGFEVEVSREIEGPPEGDLLKTVPEWLAKLRRAR